MVRIVISAVLLSAVVNKGINKRIEQTIEAVIDFIFNKYQVAGKIKNKKIRKKSLIMMKMKTVYLYTN